MSTVDKLVKLENTFNKFAKLCGFKFLGQLTPKKKVLLSCFTFGVDKVDIDTETKKNWANYCEYALLMIGEDQCDKIAMSMGEAFEIYALAYFARDTTKQMSESKNGKAYEMLMARYAKVAEGDKSKSTVIEKVAHL